MVLTKESINLENTRKIDKSLLDELEKYIDKRIIKSLKDEDLVPALSLITREDVPAFYKALYFGNIELAKKELINKDINQETAEDLPILFFAINNHPELIKPLISLGADVNVKNRDGYIPLHLAAGVGNADAINTLLEPLTNKEKVASITMQGPEGNIPLHFAAGIGSIESINILLDPLNNNQKVETITATNGLQLTPLHSAAISILDNNAEVIKVLLSHLNNRQKLASISFQGSRGYNLLHESAVSNNKEIIKTFLSQLNRSEKLKALDAQDITGQTPIHLAAKFDENDSIELFLEALTDEQKFKAITSKDKDGNIPIHAAILNDNNAAIKLFLEKLNSAQIVKALSIRNLKGLNPFSLASKRSNKDSIEAISESLSKDTPTKQPYSLNLNFSKEETLLHKFIKEGNLEAAKFLIDHDNKVTLKDLKQISINADGNKEPGIKKLHQYFSIVKSIGDILEKALSSKTTNNNLVKNLNSYTKEKDQINLSNEAQNIFEKIITNIAKNFNNIGLEFEEKKQIREKYLTKAFNQYINSDENNKLSISHYCLNKINETINKENFFVAIEKLDKSTNPLERYL